MANLVPIEAFDLQQACHQLHQGLTMRGEQGLGEGAWLADDPAHFGVDGLPRLGTAVAALVGR